MKRTLLWMLALMMGSVCQAEDITIRRDQGDRSLIFFSKKFVNSHNKLYLCSVFV